MPEEQARVPPPLSPAIEGEVSSPAQRLQSDFRRFVLLEDATYSWWHPLRSTLPARLYRLVVPAGVAHDFASVPRPLWMLISPLDLGLASIFHDWLCQRGGAVTTLEWLPESSAWKWHEQRWSRVSADELFARIMREQSVPRWRRRLAYLAVRAFGRRHWNGSSHPAGSET